MKLFFFWLKISLRILHKILIDRYIKAKIKTEYVKITETNESFSIDNSGIHDFAI